MKKLIPFFAAFLITNTIACSSAASPAKRAITIVAAAAAREISSSPKRIGSPVIFYAEHPGAALVNLKYINQNTSSQNNVSPYFHDFASAK